MHDIPEAATVKPPQQNSTSPILPEGYILRDYKIIKMLGRGGFGITYLAQEDITDKLVVIKENYPTEVSFRDMTSLTVGPVAESQKNIYDWALTRFLDEAKTLSGLSHPNIVPIRHAFKALGTAYYVMPHVKGTELHKAAPAPDSITAEWLLPMLEKILHALDYLHSQGIIHRDIKPNNILMREDGEPILIDFGTARALESTHSHTHIGTYGFMPLEQLSAGDKRGPWTDFYALGATCYYLITGELPPHSVDRIEEDEYLPLAGNPSLAGRFPEIVLSSIDKALRMKRSERWQSAQEWLNSLKSTPSSQSGESSKNIQHQLTTSPKSTQLTTKPHTSSSKKKSYTLSLIFFLLLAALIYGGFYYNHQQPAAELTRMGINPEQYNSELYAAARDGDVEKVRLLLEAGADVNWKNDANYGATPLIVAAENGHTESVRLLLAAPGIDVNKANWYGSTPLRWAAYYGHKECVRLLLAAPGIDINKASSNGDTPLIVAAGKGHKECVSLLLAAPGININKANHNGSTPLIAAADTGHTECIRLLLAAPGIDVNKADNGGGTPLYWAAYKGHTECVRLLLATPGININQANQRGDTPLKWAAYIGHTECVRLLLAAPGIDTDSYTPLCLAALNNNSAQINRLLAGGANPNQKENINNRTPLYYAASLGHTDCVRSLLAAPGIDVNVANWDWGGDSPLEVAAQNGHTECVRLLLAAPGIDVNKSAPLYQAAANGHAECVRLLLAAPRIDVNKYAPLSSAAYNGDTECVRLLLAAPGIDVNKADSGGDTPLNNAANKGHIECVRLLLAARGIDVNKANRNGSTPLSSAENNNHTECARLIREAGGRR